MKTIPISHKEYDATSIIKRFRTLTEARRVAWKDGYQSSVSQRMGLKNGKWKRFRGVWLRFDTRMHEGSASYQNHGSLRLSCTRPDEKTRGTTLVDDNQAEHATVFAATGAKSIVVGFVEVDGGEGAEYYNTDYVLVDLSRCRKQRR